MPLFYLPSHEALVSLEVVRGVHGDFGSPIESRLGNNQYFVSLMASTRTIAGWHNNIWCVCS